MTTKTKGYLIKRVTLNGKTLYLSDDMYSAWSERRNEAHLFTKKINAESWTFLNAGPKYIIERVEADEVRS